MKKTNKKIGILGWGEVGKAIGSFYKIKLIKDKEMDSFVGTKNLDVLHVCIPYSKDFEKTVIKNIENHAPDGLVIIHSTVPVGTTQAIQKRHKYTVHSPVRGVHPDLAKGIKTFVKYIGADDAGTGRLTYEHFKEIGIKSVVVFKSKTTELLKLLDTTYYGLCIAFHDYALNLCDQEGLNFERVMDDANVSYNEGYKKLKKSNVIRPVLLPPAAGKIGGHCVIPNAELLRGQFGEDPLLEAILRLK